MPARVHRDVYRVVALMLGVHGAGLALVPWRYTSGTYAVLAHLAPFRVWGVFWLAAAVVLAVWPGRWYAIGAATAALGSWAIGALTALFTGQTQAPTSFVFPLGLAVLVIRVAGTTPPARRRSRR